MSSHLLPAARASCLSFEAGGQEGVTQMGRHGGVFGRASPCLIAGGRWKDWGGYTLPGKAAGEMCVFAKWAGLLLRKISNL